MLMVSQNIDKSKPSLMVIFVLSFVYIIRFLYLNCSSFQYNSILHWRFWNLQLICLLKLSFCLTLISLSTVLTLICYSDHIRVVQTIIFQIHKSSPRRLFNYRVSLHTLSPSDTRSVRQKLRQCYSSRIKSNECEY